MGQGHEASLAASSRSAPIAVRVGLLALTVYGLLTFWGTLTHQPSPNGDFEAYARYISTTGYLVNHLVASIGGTAIGLLGFVALGAHLARVASPARLSTVAMACTVAGNALILTIFGFSTFASPAIGRAYLAGVREATGINADILGTPLLVTAALGGVLYAIGTVLFGSAIWRSGVLPRWAGILVAPAGFLIALAGLAIGEAQTLGSAMLVAGTGWLAVDAVRHSPGRTPGGRAQPRPAS